MSFNQFGPLAWGCEEAGVDHGNNYLGLHTPNDLQPEI